MPIEIWHGDDDRVVSAEQFRILARTLPLVTEHLVAGEGHFSLFARARGSHHAFRRQLQRTLIRS